MSRTSCFAILFLAIASLLGCDVPATPSLSVGVVDSTVHEFGECFPGDVLKHHFVLVNQGRDPVTVKDVKTSCACLLSGQPEDLIGQTLKPGEKIEVPAFFDTSKFYSRSTGRILVTCESLPADSDREPEMTVVDLRVGADVQPEIEFSPTELDFGTVDSLEQKEIQKQFEINVLNGKDISVSLGHVSCPALQVRRVETSNRYQITLKIDDLLSDSMQSKLNGQIEFKLTGGAMERLFLPVKAVCISPVRVDPVHLIVESDESGAISKQLTVHTSRESRIKEIKVHGVKDVTAKAQMTDAVKQHVVDVAILERAKGQGHLEVVLQLKTGDNRFVDYPVTIPFYLFR